MWYARLQAYLKTSFSVDFILFSAFLSSQPNRGKGTESSQVPSALPSPFRPPAPSISSPDGTLGTVHEPALTHDGHPKSMVNIGVWAETRQALSPSARIEWPWAVTVIMMPILWMRTWRPRGVMCLPKVMQPVPLPASPFLVFPPWRQELLGPPPRGVRGRSEDRAGASVQPIPELPVPSGRTTGHLLPPLPRPSL